MKKIKKVLLVTPPYHSGVVESAGVWLNVGFVYIAGSLRAAGYEPYIYDAMSHQHGYDEIENRIREIKPDVVATTAFTAEIVAALQVLKLSKEITPHIVTVIGNVHPTFCYQEILPAHHAYVDFIVRGEGEETLVELCHCLNAGDKPDKVRSLAFWQDGQVIVTPPRPMIQNLDALPTAWDLVDWPIYTYRAMANSRLAIVSSSRGCCQACTFCSQQLFWQKSWRGRSAENFVQELEYLRDRFGVNVVMISDETPTYARDRWEKILDLLRERKTGVKILMETRVDDIIRDKDIFWKYREAEVDHIYVGVESTSQKALDVFQKNIKVEDSLRALELINQHDIVSETSFVLGMPDDTPETIRQTLELAKFYNPDLAFFLAIAPWPYATIYQSLKDYIEVTDYSKYNLVEPVVKPVNMTREELTTELGKASRDFYFHKLQNLEKMSAKKQEFIVKVIHIITHNSYLAKAMQGIMPPEMKKIMEKLGNFHGGKASGHPAGKLHEI
jgi:anaerobic magnesium-protoporphyrin IX monomethyl ester cyclase